MVTEPKGRQRSISALASRSGSLTYNIFRFMRGPPVRQVALQKLRHSILHVTPSIARPRGPFGSMASQPRGPKSRTLPWWMSPCSTRTSRGSPSSSSAAAAARSSTPPCRRAAGVSSRNQRFSGTSSGARPGSRLVQSGRHRAEDSARFVVSATSRHVRRAIPCRRLARAAIRRLQAQGQELLRLPATNSSAAAPRRSSSSNATLRMAGVSASRTGWSQLVCVRNGLPSGTRCQRSANRCSSFRAWSARPSMAELNVFVLLLRRTRLA